MDRRERKYGFGIKKADKYGDKFVDREVAEFRRNERQAIRLTSQGELLEKEDDLQLLLSNEKQYAAALQGSQLNLSVLKLYRSWGASDQDFAENARVIVSMTGEERVKRLLEHAGRFVGSDRGRKRLVINLFNSMKKTPRFYDDEIDELIKENPQIIEGLTTIEVGEESVRYKRETLALIRMQIDFLKRKQREERQAKQTPKKAPVGETPSQPEKQEELPEQVDVSVVQETSALPMSEPFALADWRIFWTDVKFSDNPNHLVQMPADTREGFLAKLEEINAGKKAFQIKTGSVATCIEMWSIPEFRERALTSRFKWGPPHVRDWSKLVRGSVRIMVKADEDQKRLVFFAADRDTVYRGVFAGMSS